MTRPIERKIHTDSSEFSCRRKLESIYFEMILPSALYVMKVFASRAYQRQQTLSSRVLFILTDLTTNPSQHLPHSLSHPPPPSPQFSFSLFVSNSNSLFVSFSLSFHSRKCKSKRKSYLFLYSKKLEKTNCQGMEKKRVKMSANNEGK